MDWIVTKVYRNPQHGLRCDQSLQKPLTWTELWPKSTETINMDWVVTKVYRNPQHGLSCDQSLQKPSTWTELWPNTKETLNMECHLSNCTNPNRILHRSVYETLSLVPLISTWGEQYLTYFLSSKFTLSLGKAIWRYMMKVNIIVSFKKCTCTTHWFP